MSQHYDILTVNAVVLLSTGYGYILSGQQPTGFFLLFLSLCNVVGILVGRVKDLEQLRKEQQMLEEYDVEEEEEEEEDEINNDADDEQEIVEEDEEEEEDNETQPPQPTEELDVHYCGSEVCGEEITNLQGAGFCAGCELVYYCDKVCQRADWKAGHKLVCDKNVATDSISESVDEETVPEETVPETIPETVPETVEEPASVLEPVPEPPQTLQSLPPSNFSQRFPPPPPPPAAPKKDMGFVV